MSTVTHKKFDLSLLKRIVDQARPYRFLFVSTIILAIVIAPIMMLRPYVVSVMVDKYILLKDIEGLFMMAWVFLGLIVLTVILRYAMIYYSSLLAQYVVRDLRNRLFDHVLSLRLQYFDRTPIGRITTRTINDIETINKVFTQGIITMVADLLSIFAVIGIMFYTSWRLTLLVLCVIPLLLIATYIFKEKVKVAYQRVRHQLSEMNSFLQERISGMQIIQVFNAEEQEMQKFKKINHRYTQANLDAITYYATFFPTVEIIKYIGLALMVFLGTRYVIQADVSIGALMAFPWYINLLFRPITTMADKFNTLQMGMVAGERIFNLIDRHEHIPNNGNTVAEKLEGKVVFKNVRFAYDQKNDVIKDVSFDIQAGETLAIVGSTGSGKTTIINLLTRFYDIQSGQIQIDDIDIRDFELFSLRSRMAIVLQDVFLFNGTVLDNIRLRNPDITREEVIQAAKIIGAHEFIMKLNNGYQHRILERGGNLSMGQRQLISFVRALVYDPDILILDEATSAIDTETEEVIQHAIETLIEKRSSIIIAHRLSTIQHADKIIVMDHGKVLESGSHESLLEQDGRYRQLYDMQFSAELA